MMSSQNNLASSFRDPSGFHVPQGWDSLPAGK